MRLPHFQIRLIFSTIVYGIAVPENQANEHRQIHPNNSNIIYAAYRYCHCANP